MSTIEQDERAKAVEPGQAKQRQVALPTTKKDEAMETRFNRRHVYFCNKRCNFGTDDIFFPAVLSVAVRTTWFLFVLATCIYLFAHPSCKAVSIPVIFTVSIIGFVLLQAVIVLVEIVLVVVSSLGHISDGTARERINWVMYLRLMVFAVEIAWEIFSTYVVVDKRINGAVDCSSYNTAEAIYTVFVFVNWAALAVLVALFCIFLDPLGLCCVSSIVNVHQKPHQADGEEQQQQDTNSGVYRSHVSAHQFAQLYLNKRLALNDAAKALGGLLGNFNATFTDKVSAFILAAYLQKGLRNKKDQDPRGDELCQATVLLLKQDGNVGPDYNMDPTEVIDEKTQELVNVHYYHQFAMAAYGWPVYVVLNPCRGPLSLCIAAKCCCCCPREQLQQFPGDRCFPNSAALKKMAEIPETNILLASFVNNVFETPFYAITNPDPEHEEVLIAIRGTLSVNDVITDVAIAMEEVPGGLLGKECYVHSGFLASAEEIYDKLWGDVPEDSMTGGLEFQRLVKKKHYKIVIVGHSLGAGVAAVLAVLFKDRCPEWCDGLMAYTYSTPGAVMSYDLAKECNDFVISVVLGFEVVPRMTMRSLAYLKLMLKRLLETVELKKQELCCCVFCKGWTPDLPLDEGFCKLLENIDPNDPQGSVVKAQPEMYSELKSYLPFTVKGRTKNYSQRRQCHKKFLQRLDDLEGGAKVAKERQPMMFIPGKILHIEETDDPHEGIRKCCGLQRVNKVRVSWKARELFSSIQVHPDMLLDHTPSRSVNLIKMFDEQIPLGTDDEPPPPPRAKQSSSSLEQGQTTVTMEMTDKTPPQPLEVPVEADAIQEHFTTVFLEEHTEDGETNTTL